MSDVFLQLSAEDRIEALATAAAESGRPAHLLEKDVWVVWALRALFDAPLGEALVFKGGTSLTSCRSLSRVMLNCAAQEKGRRSDPTAFGDSGAVLRAQPSSAALSGPERRSCSGRTRSGWR